LTQRVMFLSCIQEIPDSNLGWDIHYTDRTIVILFDTFRKITLITSNYVITTSLPTFSISYLLITLKLKAIIVITYSIIQSIIYIYIKLQHNTVCSFFFSGNVLPLLHFPSWRQVLHLYLYWCWLSHIDKLMPP